MQRLIAEMKFILGLSYFKLPVTVSTAFLFSNLLPGKNQAVLNYHYPAIWKRNG